MATKSTKIAKSTKSTKDTTPGEGREILFASAFLALPGNEGDQTRLVVVRDSGGGYSVEQEDRWPIEERPGEAFWEENRTPIRSFGELGPAIDFLRSEAAAFGLEVPGRLASGG